MSIYANKVCNQIHSDATNLNPPNLMFQSLSISPKNDNDTCMDSIEMQKDQLNNQEREQFQINGLQRIKSCNLDK